ncbi:hypothetical protein PM085_16340 [Halorubrum ezzemoulense]|uniref:Uncharacterized protein n=1 Tax=Halorubrum ezzemoulense TaxID=337243 RepID=A0ABT4Z6M2_HALEZ|nr:hypothetical protein [Halorubrum ezzemoulense]MDB2293821.1 hypothetical protein [Halorubrum ezzemoulense]
MTQKGVKIPEGTVTCSFSGITGVSCRITDSEGNILLQTSDRGIKDTAKKSVTGELEFNSDSGELIYRISAQQKINITGGYYAIIEPGSGEQLYIVSQTSSFIDSEWLIKDADSEESIASIEATGKISTFLRRNGLFRLFLPSDYEILNNNGERVGIISNSWVSSDYKVKLRDENPIKEVSTLAPVFIHLLENNR